MADEPAFPVPDCGAYQYPGMSLRDYFAGQALAGLILKAPVEVTVENETDLVRMVVRGAYNYADAMLAARKDQTNEDR